MAYQFLLRRIEYLLSLKCCWQLLCTDIAVRQPSFLVLYHSVLIPMHSLRTFPWNLKTFHGWTKANGSNNRMNRIIILIHITSIKWIVDCYFVLQTSHAHNKVKRIEFPPGKLNCQVNYRSNIANMSTSSAQIPFLSISCSVSIIDCCVSSVTTINVCTRSTEHIWNCCCVLSSLMGRLQQH